VSFKKIISETEKLINLETGKTTRRSQLLNRLKVLKALQAEAKTIKGAEDIEKLILRKDKFGRPFLSEYQEKLKLLKDLQSNKYLNPKTNKPFTPKEWLGSTASYRSKFRDPETFLQKKKDYQRKYMAEKKKDPEFRKKYKEARTEEYFKVVDKKYKVDKGAGKAVLQLQDNKLLSYLLTAANKQKKNLKGNVKPQFEEVIKDKKFAGVKDNKTGITYHHARYKGPLGPMDKLITSHPEFDNVKDLTKIADSFKRSLPNATIASYFAKFDRVPNNAELYNFLSKDPKFVSKYSQQAMATNPLELHHRLGVEVEPTKSLQLTPRVKNNTAGVIVEEFKKGNISKDEAAKQLKKINVRVKLPGTKSYIGAKDIEPTQAVGAAKREVSKMFLERVKEDPNVINQIVERFALKVKSIPGGCRAVVTRALGGPIDACEAIIKADPERAALKLNNAITATKGPLKDLKEDSQKIVRLYRGIEPAKQTELYKAGKGMPGMYDESLKGRFFFKNPEDARYYAQRQGTLTGKVLSVDVPEKYVNIGEKVSKRRRGPRLSDEVILPKKFVGKETVNIPQTAMARAGAIVEKLKWNGDIGAFVTPNEDIASQSDIKKYAADNPIEVKVGEEPLKAATNKSVLANVGKAMARVGAPLPVAAIDAYFIGQQVKEGKGTAEIASNPLNWLGLATMEPLAKASGIAEGGGLNKALRLGLNPATIRGITRFAGLPGLAISTALTAYDQYQKYKDGEGFIFNLLNQKGTE